MTPHWSQCNHSCLHAEFLDRKKHDKQQYDDHKQELLEKKLKSEMLKAGLEELFSEAH